MLNCGKRDGDEGSAIGLQGLALVFIDSHSVLGDYNVSLLVWMVVVEVKLLESSLVKYGLY